MGAQAMLTVLFSTYNGMKTLPTMLEALTRVQSPEGGWRLVAADNGSDDGSAALIQSFRERLPLVIVDEPEGGKNRALNAALRVAEGDLYVFTDDDVVPHEDWLVQIRRAAEDQRDYAIFGGVIQPYWQRPPEDWILRHVPMGATYALTDPELPEGPVSPGLVWGANMAVRSTLFDAGHRFNDGIGPNGANYAMGSETEFTYRLSQAGAQCWFCKDAIIQHIIRPNQMEKAWIMGRAVRSGRGMYRRQLAGTPKRPQTLLGLPRWALRQWLEHLAGAGMAIARGRQDEAFYERWESNYYRGYLLEAWRCRDTVGRPVR